MSEVDPFGPRLSERLSSINFLDSCPTCLESLSGFVILPCNLGRERAELIDKIFVELGRAWRAGRHPEWIGKNWMSIDAEKLTKAVFLQDTDLAPLHTKNKNEKLLNDFGFINLDGLHTGCQKCIDLASESLCPTCKKMVTQGIRSKYFDKRIKAPLVLEQSLTSRSYCPQLLNEQIRVFLENTSGMFRNFGRSVIGGGGKSRREHFQAAIYELDHIVSGVMNIFMHNILFHSAVKVALLAFQQLSFRSLSAWTQLADAAIEWNLSWIQHLVIWKVFVSCFNYSFKQFSVNLTYTSLSVHVNRLDVLVVLWLAFKLVYRTDFGWLT